METCVGNPCVRSCGGVCPLTVGVADARAEGGACEQVFTGRVKPRLLPTLTHPSRGQKRRIITGH